MNGVWLLASPPSVLSLRRRIQHLAGFCVVDTFRVCPGHPQYHTSGKGSRPAAISSSRGILCMYVAAVMAAAAVAASVGFETIVGPLVCESCVVGKGDIVYADDALSLNCFYVQVVLHPCFLMWYLV